ncbi:MAG: bi-domain-containing oxidoreductase [Planctomycetota bacterium]|mgnify:CR=1 FL=1
MLQVLGTSAGIAVARMPTPSIGSHDLLVRTRWSLISTGTETASLPPGGGPVPVVNSTWRLSEHSLPAPDTWTPLGGAARQLQAGQSWWRTPPESYAYALESASLRLAGGCHHAFSVRLRIGAGNVSFGVLKADGSAWLGTRVLHLPRSEQLLRVDLDLPVGAETEVRLVLSNHRPEGIAASEFALVEATHLSWEAATDALAATATPVAPSTLERLLPFLRKTEERVAQVPRLVADADLPRDDSTDQGWALGYSAAGEVVAVGAEVRGFAPGDLVACAGAGRASHAEWISVPVLLAAKLPPGLDCRAACTATVGAIALQGVRRAEPQLGERVAVIGLGLIGQLTVQLLRAAGCRVYGFDPQVARVEQARRRGLADGASDDKVFRSLIDHITGAVGVDAVIIAAAAKSAAPINLAMQICRRRGKVVVSGDIDLHPERADFYKKELDLRMATSYGPGRYDATYEEEGRDYPIAQARWTANRNLQAYLDCLADGSVTVDDLVGGEYAVEHAAGAYARLLGPGERPLALLLRYSQASEILPAAALAVDLRGAQPLTAGPLRVGLVGAGAFAQSMLAPKLVAAGAQLAALVSRSAERGGNTARILGIPRLASDPAALLSDPGVDALIIATRHHEHAAQVTAALRAGKHVFVEKPLAITREGLEAVCAAVAAAPSKQPPVLAVGFNRRVSPAALRLQEELAARRAPLTMVYRINAGRIPPDHWVQGPQGGGRNLGEACHFYDLFRALAGAPVCSFQAQALGQRSGDVLPNDHFSALIGYEDGSVATLVYAANGPKTGLSKERLEVFCDGRAWLLDDYVRLERAGAESPLWQGEVDKGHGEEMRRFVAACAGGPWPIPFSELAETTALALNIEERLR